MPLPQATPSMVRGALLSGALASVASAAVLTWRGRVEAGDAAAPLNGPSQWIWGRHAPSMRGFSVRYTIVGYAIHHLAATFWAALFEGARRRRDAVVPLAVGTAAIANVVDYKLTPKRLQPGYERQISRGSLAMAYVAFAAGLAAGALLQRR